MKAKNLLIILLIIFLFLLYNLMCYNYLNKQIKRDTKSIIVNVLDSENYEFLKATSNKDGALNIYVKYNNNKYHFTINRINNKYHFISYDYDIPSYIK